MAHAKQITIEHVIRIVNRNNRIGTCSREHRQGQNALLEEILHITDSYAGYRFLTKEETPAGHPPGRALDSTGYVTFPDDSRRHYYSDVGGS